MAIPKLPIDGKDVRVELFIDGKPQQNTDLARSVTITERSTKFLDKYLGRTRDRTDKILDGYDCKLEFDYVDAVLVKALQAIDAKRDANQPIPTLSVGLVFANRDSSFDGFVVQRCTGSFEIGVKGKDERASVMVDLQGEDLVVQVL